MSAAPGTKMSPKMSPSQQQRLSRVILAPVISEKSTYVAEKMNQVIFRVESSATKPEIKAAVELMFKVQVDSITVSNVRGKSKRFGQYMGRRPHWKKAYVSLKPGQEINFAEQAEAK